MGLFDKKPPVEGLNYFGKPNLPPGQYKTEKFPVLTYGDVPALSTKDWKFDVGGLVELRSWTWDEFMKLPQSKLKADFHCVTHWSRFGDVWEGVMFKDLLATLTLKHGAKYVLQHAYGGYTTNLPLSWMRDEDVMFVHTVNGKPLEREHGGPMRVFTPRRYAWKGAKWVKGLEFLA
ncbi:MAG: molybdopterin-dependent oxidoreductase, partial [Ignavibacteriales bacterium]|nr:molybdopterin-dependent oxidoreductase [Ignavibacteriales bacterium]